MGEKKQSRKAKAQETAADFNAYRQALPEADAARLQAFFDDFELHCRLQKKEAAALRKDFQDALLYYAEAGRTLDDALELLDLSHLGTFYNHPPIQWYPLDNAAKIYPLSMKQDRMEVFRLSVNMKEELNPVLLQMALNFSIKRFPGFATTVKKGFFWHFLDSTKRRYRIEPESGIPCQPIRVAISGSQTFRVLYYGRRLSVEFFHILCDGSGGLEFIKALVAEYLRLCGVQSDEEGIFDRDALPCAEEVANEFHMLERNSERPSGFVDAPATQMSGELAKIKPCRVLHLRMSCAQLKEQAAARGTTIGCYMLSKVFLASKACTDELDGKISIQVPVNMRKFYPSKTLRNFSMYCGLRFAMDEIDESPEFIARIAAQLQDKASQEAMDEMMSSASKLVHSLRFVPLFIKQPVCRAVYGILSDTIFSNTLSNMGVVKMPAGYAQHIESMDFLLGPGISNRAGCTLISFGDVCSLGISKTTLDPCFEEALYRLLDKDGIQLSVEGSPIYGY